VKPTPVHTAPFPPETLAEMTTQEVYDALSRLYARLADLTVPAPPAPEEIIPTEEAWVLAGESSRDTFLRRDYWRRALAGARRRPLRWRRDALLKIKAGQAAE
jgi:hypothetical protein